MGVEGAKASQPPASAAPRGGTERAVRSKKFRPRGIKLPTGRWAVARGRPVALADVTFCVFVGHSLSFRSVTRAIYVANKTSFPVIPNAQQTKIVFVIHFFAFTS